MKQIQIPDTTKQEIILRATEVTQLSMVLGEKERTFKLLMGNVLLSFGYDPKGYLLKISANDGNVYVLGALEDVYERGPIIWERGVN